MIGPRPIELVIFDCDGVLVDTERLAVRIDVRVLAELGWALTEQEVIDRFVGRSEAYMAAEITRHLGRPLPDGWDVPFRRLYREAFAAELGPVPGVVEALDQITAPRASLPAGLTRRCATRSASPASMSASRAGSSAPRRCAAASRRPTSSTRRRG